MDLMPMDGTDIATATDSVSTGRGNEATTINNNNSVSPTSANSEHNETITPWECQLFMENVSIQFDESSNLIPLKGKTDVISMAKHGKIYFDRDKYSDETDRDKLCSDIRAACDRSGYHMCRSNLRQRRQRLRRPGLGDERYSYICEVATFNCYHYTKYKKADAEPKTRKRKRPTKFPLACERCEFGFEIYLDKTYLDKIGFVFSPTRRTTVHVGHPKRNPVGFKRPKALLESKILSEEQKCDLVLQEEGPRNVIEEEKILIGRLLPRAPDIDSNGYYMVEIKSNRLGIDVNKDKDSYFVVKKVGNESPLNGLVQINDRIISINEKHMRKELSLNEFVEYVSSISTVPKIIKLNRPSLKDNLSRSTGGLGQKQETELNSKELGRPTQEQDFENGDGTENNIETYEPVQFAQENAVEASAMSSSENDTSNTYADVDPILNMDRGTQLFKEVVESVETVKTSEPWTPKIFFENCYIVNETKKSQTRIKDSTDIMMLNPNDENINMKIYFDLERYKDQNDMKKLVKDIKTACLESGFSLKQNGTNYRKGLDDSRMPIYRFYCSHCRQDTCTFSFEVSHDGFGFIFESPMGNKQIHTGHKQLRINEMTLRKSEVTKRIHDRMIEDAGVATSIAGTHGVLNNGDGTENNIETYEPVQFAQENAVEASAMSSNENDTSNTYAVVDLKDCKVMISFHDETGGADVEKLCYCLNHFNIPTFCKREFCLDSTNAIIGSNECQYAILMLTDGWQKSKNCQREAEILKNIEVANDLTVIPVWYKTFNMEKDSGEYGHFHWKRWNSRPCIMFRETSPNWVNQIITLLKSFKIDKIPEHEATIIPNPDVSIDSSYCQIRNEGEKEYFQGNYDKALSYFELALKFCEKLHGRQDPKTALILTDIGLIYYKTNNFDQALEYYEKAKAIQEEKLGSQHSSLSKIFNHLGAVYESKCMYPQAFDHYNKAKNIITEENIDRMHAEVAIASHNVACLYEKTNEYDLALQNFVEAKTTFENIFGEGSQHPFLINTYKSISVMSTRKNGCLQNSGEIRPIHEKVVNGHHSIILNQARRKELEAHMSKEKKKFDAELLKVTLVNQSLQQEKESNDLHVKNLDAEILSLKRKNVFLQEEKKKLEATDLHVKNLDTEILSLQRKNVFLQEEKKNLEAGIWKLNSTNQQLHQYFEAEKWKLNSEKQLSDQCFKDRIVETEDKWRQKVKDTTDLLEKYKRENKVEIDKKQDMIANLKDDVKIWKAQLKCAESQKDQIIRELKNVKEARQYESHKNIAELKKMEEEYQIESYRKIASAFYKKGYYGEALAYYEKTIAIQEEKLGSRHPSFGDTFNGLGRVLYKQSKFKEAMNYFFRARAIQEEYHHPSLGETCRNIGLVIHKHGIYDEALDYFQSARVFQEKGGDTSSLAKTYNCIGLVHSSKNNYGEALRYYDKARSIQEEVDVEDPSLAKTFYNIGVLYNSRGFHELALKHHNKAREIQEKAGQHPSLAETYNAIGLVYFGQRNFEEALNMYGKAKEIQEKFLDKNNLDVSETFNNIGVTKCLQGEYDEALEWCHKAKAIDEELLGLQHPLLSSTYSNLGYVYSEKGDDELSRQYYDKANSIAGR